MTFGGNVCLGLRAILCASLMSVAVGCRAKPGLDAGFIQDPQVLQKNDKVPFDRYWANPSFDLRSYSKVYVAPVDTQHLLKGSWWDRTSLSNSQKDEANVLGPRFQSAVKESFGKYDDRKYEVVEAPQADAMIVELALVELVPTKVWLNAITEIVAGAFDQGSTSFEGRIRDGKTGTVIAEFKDREFGQMSIISVADLEWWAHAKHTIDHWAEQLPEVTNRKPDEEVSNTSTVTLRPW
jgi:hypothetical protein